MKILCNDCGAELATIAFRPAGLLTGEGSIKVAPCRAGCAAPAEKNFATEEGVEWDRERFSCEYCGALECVCPEELEEDTNLPPGAYIKGATEEPLKFAVEPGYAPLAFVLQEALDQAQRGKGRTCHANNKPFLEQEIITEGRSLGTGGHVFQIRKKVREAMNCEDTDRAVEDLLGAIVYTAAMVLLRRERK